MHNKSYLRPGSMSAHPRLLITMCTVAPCSGVRGSVASRLAFISVSSASSTFISTSSSFRHQLSFHNPRRRPRVRIHPSSPSPTCSLRALRRFDSNDAPEGVVRAVERLRDQARVTAADVATASGIDVRTATDGLVSLAGLTGAAIDVTDDGEIAYRFPFDVRARLRASSLRAKLRMAWDTAYPVLFTGVRIGFGALLILSIVVTFVAIAAISASASAEGNGSSSSSSSSDDSRRSGGSFSGGFIPSRIFAPNIFDVMFYSQPRYVVYDGYASSPYASRRGRGYERKGDSESEMSFLEAVYSFVFGDGDTNADLSSRRWRAVAAVIRANDGAVTAEQLRPFLDAPPQKSSASLSVVDESFVLPALQRLGGRPEVTDAGDIIYVFPDLVTTGRAGGAAPRFEFVGDIETQSPYLAERPARFSRASEGQRVLAFGLGIVNLIGVLTLGSMLATARPMTPDATSLISLAKGIYPALAAYALSFVVLPAARLIRQRLGNKEIKERNEARQIAAQRLENGDPEIRRKLAAAKEYRVQQRVLRERDVVYSTDADAEEIERRAQQTSKEDFDRRLEERT